MEICRAILLKGWFRHFLRGAVNRDRANRGRAVLHEGTPRQKKTAQNTKKTMKTMKKTKKKPKKTKKK